jgi:hypothetical protein
MLNINNTEISRLFVDGVEIDNAYLNGGLIYSKVGAFTATYQIDDINEPLTLPVSKDYEVEWGDNVTTTTGNQHFYASIGVKTVKMFGLVDDFAFNNGGDKLKIRTIENWGGFVGLLSSLFNGCTLLGDVYPTSGVTISRGSAFRDCDSVNVDLTNTVWIGNPANSCFFRCDGNFTGLNTFLPIGNDVNGLNATFNNCNFNEDISYFDTSNVIDFRNIFAFNDVFNQDVSGWDFSNAGGISGFMTGKSALNYDYQYYDNLLNKWASGAANGGLDFTKITNLTTNFGTIQYSSAGEAAHDSLVAQGLIITDGGQNAF